MLARKSFGLVEVLQRPYGLLHFGRHLQSTQTCMHMCHVHVGSIDICIYIYGMFLDSVITHVYMHIRTQ